MKNYLIGLCFFILAVSCSSPQKAIKKGDYDKAVKLSVKKLLNNPVNKKEIQSLEKTYQLANQSNIRRINMLKTSGQPDIWDEICRIYIKMSERQDLVSRLDQSIQNSIKFTFVDYIREINEAKRKASEFLYAHATMLLQKEDRFSAREAYRDLEKVKSYYNYFKDTDEMIQEALEKGVTQILFKIQNHSGIPLPEAFEEELTKISLSEFNRKWYHYDTQIVKEKYYHYIILLNIKRIMISPEKINESSYSQSREIDDGWEYLLDKRGNVKKDSLGNDLKKQKKKTIKCHIVETRLNKMATIEGNLDFIDNYSDQLIKTDPIAASSVFEYFFITANGDLNALDEKTYRLLKNKPVPFPPNPVLILQASTTLKDLVKGVINKNRMLIK